MKLIVKEIFRRVLEMFALEAVCSLALKTVTQFITMSFPASVCTGLVFFALFQACNIWLCRKSNRRMWHDRYCYYLSNLSACAIFWLIGITVYALGFVDIFLKLFNVTITLTVFQQMSNQIFLLTYSLFFLVSGIVIVLAKEYKYMFKKKK